ncbi:hypothetical protein PPSQR21_008860 [Paenibacillus polymyxa SQR-21]|nr:hypothetical protein PPSQR21_008860 [Paenibacillus polymyxa SQR-21]
MKETEQDYIVREGYHWNQLVPKTGIELKSFYKLLLLELGQADNELLKEIYSDATSLIRDPRNLEKIVKSIDALDWYDVKEEGLGNLYEGLLEKFASELKSGGGQYFTPRVLIDVIVQLVNPQPRERCHDPAAGTFGFMIAANRYVRVQTDDYFTLAETDVNFQKYHAFSGVELVKDTHRLARINAVLYDIHGEPELGDILSSFDGKMGDYDVIMTNPPFGPKKWR